MDGPGLSWRTGRAVGPVIHRDGGDGEEALKCCWDACSWMNLNLRADFEDGHKGSRALSARG